MAVDTRVICESGDVVDGGKGARFDVERSGKTLPAFAVRFRGRVYAYLNQCSHIGVELDWMPGEFFDDSGLYLICSMHGAVYQPETGHCRSGPCQSASLVPVAVEEHDGKIYLMEQSRDG
jgi:nitrite reductase/ring-hydroxylating ferredoxin subunit